MSKLEGAIAATRFGMGARPGEIAAASSDPRGWLKSQIKADAAIVPSTGLLSIPDVFKARAEAYGGNPPPGAPGAAPVDNRTAAQRMVQQQVQREAREGLQKEVEARSTHAVATTSPFAERWARFWANHFTVAARNAQLVGVVGPFEREAIRPYIFTTFAELTASSSFHPGMLMYLDANRSIGPSTEAAKRRNAGLNENLAREILELHTMGVGSGYSQADIIEFAKALTGWTVGNQQTARMAGLGGGQGGGQGNPRQRRAQLQRTGLDMTSDMIGKTVFIEPLHEPGARTVLGKKYGGDAKLQAAAILDDVVKHPATAHHISVKLVRHFVADDPPPAAVAKIEAAFNKSGGNLAKVAAAVIDLNEAWSPTPVKFKTPDELLVSAARATGAAAAFGRDQRLAYTSLAQQPFSAPAPTGWPDDTASWSGSDAVMKRLEWANAVARRMSTSMSPTDFLDAALGEIASEGTRKSVSRAESAEQGFTLALMSPEFQRR